VQQSHRNKLAKGLLGPSKITSTPQQTGTDLRIYFCWGEDGTVFFFFFFKKRIIINKVKKKMICLSNFRATKIFNKFWERFPPPPPPLRRGLLSLPAKKHNFQDLNQCALKDSDRTHAVNIKQSHPAIKSILLFDRNNEQPFPWFQESQILFLKYETCIEFL
jgi:hypothetical protein